MIRLTSLAIGISGLLLASSGAAADWMTFAIDGKGHFGHGVGSTETAAINFARSYCGQPDCHEIYPHPQSGCMALAQSFERGYTVMIGTAPTQKVAQEFAMQFCADTRPVTTWGRFRLWRLRQRCA